MSSDESALRVRQLASKVGEFVAIFLAYVVGLAFAGSFIVAGWFVWEPIWETYIRQGPPGASAPPWVSFMAGVADSMILVGPVAGAMVAVLAFHFASQRFRGGGGA